MFSIAVCYSALDWSLFSLLQAIFVLMLLGWVFVPVYIASGVSFFVVDVLALLRNET